MKKKLTLAALLALAGAVAAVSLALWWLSATGRLESLARRAIVARIGEMTAGRVELGAFHFDSRRLEARLERLVIHGREAASLPLFSAEELRVRLRVVSFFRRKLDLEEVVLRRPALRIVVDAQGRTNVPAPRRPAPPASKPVAERLFDLSVKQFRIEGGEFRYERAGAPAAIQKGLEATLGGLELALDYDAREFYAGRIAWRELRVVAGRYRPAVTRGAGEFRIERNRIECTRLEIASPHSRLQVAGTMEHFAAPSFRFRYDASVQLAELGEILLKPRMPAGLVEFSGEGNLSRDARLELAGEFRAREIAMRYRYFHQAGMTATGRYEVRGDALRLPEFTAQALGGTIRGSFEIASLRENPRMRVEARAQALDLAAVNEAVSNPSLPLAALDWGGRMDVDATVAWRGEFNDLATAGTGIVSPSSAPVNLIPVSARFDYRYAPVAGGSAVQLRASRIETRASVLELEGTLGSRSSDLALSVATSDLSEWNDLVNTLRGVPDTAAPVRVRGHAQFHGRVLGTFARPIFAGHVVCESAAYESMLFDRVEGDVRYAPDALRLTGTRVERGRTRALGQMELRLKDWSFRAESELSLSADVRAGEAGDLETYFGRTLPVRGALAAHLEMIGTRAEPHMRGRFAITRGTFYGQPIDSLRAMFRREGEDYWFEDVALAENAGRVSGQLHYNNASGEGEFRATGSNIHLEHIPWLQSPRLPLQGVAQFDLTGKGPLRAPGIDGTLRLAGVKIGEERIGGLEARFKTAGHVMRVELFAAMHEGNLTGEGEVRLEDDLPMQARLEFTGFDLDPFYITAFHLTGLTSHSSSDGTLEVTGMLRRPASLEIVADIARLEFAYQEIALRNEGPLRFSYRREEVRIERAHITGPGTDFTLSGYARYPADPAAGRDQAAARRMNLNLNGSVNLGLVREVLPGLQTSGNAQVQATVFGTLGNPQINGRVSVSDAAVSFAELPTRLAQMRGEMVFNASRMEIEHLEAQAGGGKLVISGGVNYASGVSYDFRAQARQVRIRYPEGVSWLVDGRLRLAGTPVAALLAGDVEVFRAAIAAGFNFGALLLRMKESPAAPATTSRFLRNLQFQIQATSAPGVRLEWANAHFQSEASLRVRGTWEHPVILGHIHLLAGEFAFRGNKYQVTRGDINFANPFRVDPVLNLEAETRVLQYDVTLNFSGPLSRLSLAYRSDPPLPSSDIIALLALGRPGEESQLRSAQQVQVPELGATALLTEAVSSQVGGRIERLFGVSRFRVDPFLAGTEQTPSARITIERAVTRDLTLTYISNVTSAQQQIIQIEYAVNREVSIIALRDQNGTFGLDIKFKKRFK